jgi:hypothetical protein
MKKEVIKHPATYTNSFLPIFAEILSGCNNVLDPFGGVGKIALIKDFGFIGKVYANEIEPEWVLQSPYKVDEWHIGDSANMDWAIDGMFDSICTSPTYGNRMADHHEAKDSSRRITYKHYLGRNLSEDNTGKMQWGGVYREKHMQIYKECSRVLKIDGLMVVNISNHIRRGEEIDVSKWHKDALISLGFVLKNETKIHTPRMKFGSNSRKRTEFEYIYTFIKS